MTRTRQVRIIAAVALASLLFGACGDDDDGAAVQDSAGPVPSGGDGIADQCEALIDTRTVGEIIGRTLVMYASTPEELSLEQAAFDFVCAYVPPEMTRAEYLVTSDRVPVGVYFLGDATPETLAEGYGEDEVISIGDLPAVADSTDSWSFVAIVGGDLGAQIEVDGIDTVQQATELAEHLAPSVG